MKTKHQRENTNPPTPLNNLFGGHQGHREDLEKNAGPGKESEKNYN